MAGSAEYGISEDEIEGAADGGASEEVTKKYRGELKSIYNSPDNGDILDVILLEVEARYDEKEKRKEWDDVLDQMKNALLATEEEDDITQILENYLRKIKTELT